MKPPEQPRLRSEMDKDSGNKRLCIVTKSKIKKLSKGHLKKSHPVNVVFLQTEYIDGDADVVSLKYNKTQQFIEEKETESSNFAG